MFGLIGFFDPSGRLQGHELRATALRMAGTSATEIWMMPERGSMPMPGSLWAIDGWLFSTSRRGVINPCTLRAGDG